MTSAVMRLFLVALLLWVTPASAVCQLRCAPDSRHRTATAGEHSVRKTRVSEASARQPRPTGEKPPASHRCHEPAAAAPTAATAGVDAGAEADDDGRRAGADASGHGGSCPCVTESVATEGTAARLALDGDAGPAAALWSTPAIFVRTSTRPAGRATAPPDRSPFAERTRPLLV